jgi:hypothetical protein
MRVLSVGTTILVLSLIRAQYKEYEYKLDTRQDLNCRRFVMLEPLDQSTNLLFDYGQQSQLYHFHSHIAGVFSTKPAGNTSAKIASNVKPFNYKHWGWTRINRHVKRHNLTHIEWLWLLYVAGDVLIWQFILYHNPHRGRRLQWDVKMPSI